jgi:hypothetical protein
MVPIHMWVYIIIYGSYHLGLFIMRSNRIFFSYRLIFYSYQHIEFSLILFGEKVNLILYQKIDLLNFPFAYVSKIQRMNYNTTRRPIIISSHLHFVPFILSPYTSSHPHPLPLHSPLTLFARDEV